MVIKIWAIGLKKLQKPPVNDTNSYNKALPWILKTLRIFKTTVKGSPIKGQVPVKYAPLSLGISRDQSFFDNC